MAFLFGKKKKDVGEEMPELPELPELPPLPKLEFPRLQPRFKEEISPLPAFPSSLTGENIAREAVKHAITEPEEESLGLPSKSMTREIEEKEFEFQVEPERILAKETPQKIPHIMREFKPLKAEPVYVRLDKYQESLSNFQEIKRKALEIENLLKEIREIKAKEESQLEEWEREIQETKVKLDRIDRTIFQKLGE